MTEQTQVALYQGVNIEQAAYIAAFSQPQGLQAIIDQITLQAHEQAKGLDACACAIARHSSAGRLNRWLMPACRVGRVPLGWQPGALARPARNARTPAADAAAGPGAHGVYALCEPPHRRRPAASAL